MSIFLEKLNNFKQNNIDANRRITFNDNQEQVGEIEKEISRNLKERIKKEHIDNFKFVIKQISDNFDKAIDSKDLEEIKESKKIIKGHENYLGEKYRDSESERDYMLLVQAAIKILEDKIIMTL
jgi:soluble cytochrome b562